jgi:hypothetical protein
MKNLSSRNGLTLFLIIAMKPVGKANDPIIAKGRQQRAAVVITERASPVEPYAAREVRQAMQLMFGAAPGMVRSRAVGGARHGNPVPLYKWRGPGPGG